ncbi:hypothetical protein KEM52_003103 [Ascosphaera acerosa]|nr:hypothetical protein KEM52_003103 [Ascosphaera acerosa]
MGAGEHGASDPSAARADDAAPPGQSAHDDRAGTGGTGGTGARAEQPTAGPGQADDAAAADGSQGALAADQQAGLAEGYQEQSEFGDAFGASGEHSL